LVAQLSPIVLATLAVGWLAESIREPRVTGELLAGILLGPSLLGWLAPRLSALIFPPASFGVPQARAVRRAHQPCQHRRAHGPGGRAKRTELSFEAWSGTDENRILSYYAQTVSLEVPGMAINGRAAVRDQFVRPFIAGFPGNDHITKSMIFGKDIVVVEWSFEADHRGPFAGRAATGCTVKLPGCGLYELDPANRRITAARIYFDVTTLLKQISSHRPQVLQNLLISWFASRALTAGSTPFFGERTEK
jgi:hypothetical protein